MIDNAPSDNVSSKQVHTLDELLEKLAAGTGLTVLDTVTF